MTPAAFLLFISEVRRRSDEPSRASGHDRPLRASTELRRQYHQSVAGWRKLFALTEEDAIELHLAA